MRPKSCTPKLSAVFSAGVAGHKVVNGTYPAVHSVLIVKEGKLVFEEYFPGRNYDGFWVEFTRQDTHRVMSITKSFTSTLIGIAIDKGLI